MLEKKIKSSIALCSCILLSSCLVTTKQFNRAKQELNKYHNDFATKTGELAEATSNINTHLLSKAKETKNTDDIIYLAKNESTLADLLKDFEKLASTELSMTENSLGFLSGLLQGITDNPIVSMIITLMGGGSILGMVKQVSTSKKLKKVRAKAIEYAHSNNIDPIDPDVLS